MKLYEEYGSPSVVSNNGKIYIFKQKHNTTLNVFSLTSDGFVFVKKIDVIKSVKNYVK